MQSSIHSFDIFPESLEDTFKGIIHLHIWVRTAAILAESTAAFPEAK